ncbi:MAG: acetolactate decarboxylase [Lachnospiraceae bacterium]|nr:acetolactate decarboxylase [Lachnospiraceae bacterium]
MKNNMITKVTLSAVCLSLMIGASGCGLQNDNEIAESTTHEETPEDRDTLYQVSLLQGLLQGDYNGSISIGELKACGDTGIGTFDRLNGELIMVDGVVYRAAGDGTVEVPSDDETIPFSNVTFMDADEEVSINNVASFDDLMEILNGKVAELGGNRFYMIRIDGVFNTVYARSEYAQDKPYEPLVVVLETDQTFFDMENVSGTVVGLYCPAYMSELNNAGWHLHFISDDRTSGGHVLDLAIEEAVITWDYTDNFEMILPDNDEFTQIDFSIDRSEDVRRAETNE